jgi:hypothetical protein
MTTAELIAGKTAALGMAVVSSLTTALASASQTPSLPLEWSGILALIGAVYGYGRLSGELRERQKAEDKRYKRLTKSNQYLEAAVTRVAEKLNVPLSDLQAQFQDDED